MQTLQLPDLRFHTPTGAYAMPTYQYLKLRQDWLYGFALWQVSRPTVSYSLETGAEPTWISDFVICDRSGLILVDFGADHNTAVATWERGYEARRQKPIEMFVNLNVRTENA